MSGMAVAQRMTVAEYLELDEPRTWLVEGEVVVNEPRASHQRAAADLLIALTLWCRAAQGRGEVTLPIDVALDEYNCFGPDLLWYREGRGPGRSEVRPQPMPDIVDLSRFAAHGRREVRPLSQSSRSRTCCATLPAVIPSFSSTSPPGAEAPKRSIETIESA